MSAVPDAPQNLPEVSLENTNAQKIGVAMPPLLISENGGSMILSYELSLYNITTESWQSLTGGSPDFSLLSIFVYGHGIQKGEIYKLRYRAWNINGASEWSSFGYIRAAQVPSRPETPNYLSSDVDSVTIGISPSHDDGG